MRFKKVLSKYSKMLRTFESAIYKFLANELEFRILLQTA